MVEWILLGAFIVTTFLVAHRVRRWLEWRRFSASLHERLTKLDHITAARVCPECGQSDDMIVWYEHAKGRLLSHGECKHWWVEPAAVR